MEGSGTGGSVSPTLAAPTEPPTLLGPGEVIKPSGKFPKPTKIPGKNYSKDEVVIRNADSGKGISMEINYEISLRFSYQILNTNFVYIYLGC